MDQHLTNLLYILMLLDLMHWKLWIQKKYLVQVVFLMYIQKLLEVKN